MSKWLLLGFTAIFAILSRPSLALDLKEEIAKEKALLEEATKKEAAILKELELLAQKIEKKRAEIEVLQEEIARRERELAQLMEQIAQKDESIRRLQKRFQERLKILATTGKIGWLNLLFAPGDIPTTLRRSTYFQFLILHDQNMALRLLQEKKGLAREKKLVLAEKQRLSLLKKQLEEEVATLKALRQEKLALLEEVRRNIRLYRETLKHLEAAYQSIERLAKELRSTKEELKDVKEALAEEKKRERATPRVPLLELKGLLLPPVEGVVLRLFGLYKDPITGENIYQPGIFISASVGTPVKAPYGGVVAKIALIKGQGQVVFINHGYDFLSIIGGLGKLEVNLGAEVKTGEVIGEVGELPFSESGVYYELRYHDKPQNPLDWLDTSKLRFLR